MSLKEKALTFATKMHEGQMRKANSRPYIVHPIEVSKILEAANLEESVVIAGLLHDTVEDTPATIEEIASLFGEEVALLVAAHTEDKSRSWEERKTHTIEVVKKGTLPLKALIAADKLSNLKSLQESYEEQGEEVWTHFKRGYEKQKWYYLNVAHNLFIGLKEEEVPAFFYKFRKETEIFFDK
ncbi:phosphohydrolase [Priestia filamentosa]|uniref:Phosphohydrolase n=1 Tax=Priestia filamentosa TaxID=1402861 RepID=A0A1X7E628_9BACI|nr:HD domain-containing protein [Priestia filamentosa]AKO92492.1 phosphohydrolase [Priestia filamentosa]MDT3762559.1 HD domain-containing protein [Priestia filamentosa]OXS69108.1 phosphohydrolase [Priestia filamentosa]WRU97025.1 HD domain-containing protein [Priestia filamentosa]SMF28251.1 HD domain-containing protein [Priestia filamentosa]